jgi:hypothetical protein
VLKLSSASLPNFVVSEPSPLVSPLISLTVPTHSKSLSIPINLRVSIFCCYVLSPVRNEIGFPGSTYDTICLFPSSICIQDFVSPVLYMPIPSMISLSPSNCVPNHTPWELDRLISCAMISFVHQVRRRVRTQPKHSPSRGFDSQAWADHRWTPVTGLHIIVAVSVRNSQCRIANHTD